MAKEKEQYRNILVISTGSGLFKPNSGDRSRFFNLAVQLSKRNRVIVLQPHNVKDILDLSVGNAIYFKTDILGRTFSILTDFNPSFIIKFLRMQLTNKIDIIQISHPSGVLASKLLCRLLRKNIPIIYDAHNVDSDSIQSGKYFLKSSVPFIKKVITKFVIFWVPIIEMIAVNCADFIISVSEIDRIRFIKKFGINPNRIAVITNGTHLNSIISQQDQTKLPEINHDKKVLIFFHGSFHQAANFEAFNLIRNYIAPVYTKTNEDDKAIFLVAGTDCPVFEGKNIKSIGFVNDLYSLLQGVDIAIVPIRAGGGTKLKMLDYMGIGLPIVTTKKGIEGINAKNGEHALIVDDVNEEFIDAIKYLIDNEQEREIIGANARRLAEEEYDWDKIGEKLDKLYKRILGEGKHANK